MGNYLNPDIITFTEAVESDIYVDKTELLKYTNSILRTTQKYICISRPRRFGKSITANMLAAYYECEQDSKELFSKFKISISENFEKHLNQYDTILLNMQEFLSKTKNIEEMIELVKKSVIWDLLDKYPDFRYFDNTNLMRTMQDVYSKTKRQFVVIIDEWGEVSQALKNSADTLNAIWQKRPKQVAEGIRQAHFETSYIQYNDENALSYTISLALYAARNSCLICGCNNILQMIISMTMMEISSIREMD